MLASARRRVLKTAAVYGSLPLFGRNVGRAISPAAGALRNRRALRGKALPDPAGYFRRQPAMHPSVCAFRRIQLPLQGSLSVCRPLKSLLCKGRCRRRRRRGAAPDPANILPGRRILPAAIHPAKRGARPCRTLRDISAAKRQCTPQSAPSGASGSPCRGAFRAANRRPLQDPRRSPRFETSLIHFCFYHIVETEKETKSAGRIRQALPALPRPDRRPAPKEAPHEPHPDR